MVNIDFFDTKHKTEPPRNDTRFNLYDPGENHPVITTTDPNLYQAKVSNDHNYLIELIPIDHNIDLKDSNDNQLSTCDGLLHTVGNNGFIAFFELKDEMKDWITDAVSQLEQTIEIFRRHHKSSDFLHRYAFAANKRHPRFAFSHKEMMQQFKNRYDFHLLIQNDIVVR